MSFAEYPTLDAGALAALLRAREVTPTEVLAAAEAAHTQWHGAINAVVEWYADPSPGSLDGPWAGVPMLRKDDGATEAGRLVERGSRLSAGWRAASTSLLFRRFAAAGLVVLGRSAVPEFILHATTESRVHGVTHNPWDRRWSAGGSSGGAAAAVAAGVVPVAHASDCAGSIRIPAAACGLIGLKPTRGRVPWGEGGVAGGWGGIAEELVVARTVRDLQAVLGFVADAGAARSRAGGAGPATRPLRVGLLTAHWAGLAADPVLVRAVEEAGGALTGLGAAVTPIEWPLPYERIAALMDPLFGAAAVAEMEAVGAALGRPLDDAHLESVTLAVLEAVRSLPAGSVERAWREAAMLTAELDRWWERFDVVLCSTLGRAALPLGRLGGEVAYDEWVAAND
ncbi:MAG: amidase family protein, partial [Acidimicrobiia bacterium]